MIIKTENSRIIANVDLINVEYSSTSDTHKVICTTAGGHRILLAEYKTESEAIELIKNIYAVTPGALSLDPSDIPDESIEIR